MNASVEDIKEIHGFGEVIAQSVYNYFAKEENKEMVNKLRSILNIKGIEKSENQSLKGLTFVITGNVTHFKNRNELKEKIESLGGKVTGTVTSNTNYLINNDINSTSSKNRKAKELGIPIIEKKNL